jgi:hypothetical protein
LDISDHRPPDAGTRKHQSLTAWKWATMFDPFDRTVDRTLRKLAKQRVRLVLQPGDYWVIDSAIPQDDDTHAALMTCRMRGWIEPLHHAVPSTQLTPHGALPPNMGSDKMLTLYRLTSASWSVIHRSDLIAICALLISAMSLSLAIFGIAHRP